MTLDIPETQEIPEDTPTEDKNRQILRTAGKYRGKIKMSEDFDKPLDEFQEYM